MCIYIHIFINVFFWRINTTWIGQKEWSPLSWIYFPHIWWIHVDKDNYVPTLFLGPKCTRQKKNKYKFQGVLLTSFSYLCTWIIELVQCVTSCQQLPNMSRLILTTCLPHPSVTCLVHHEGHLTNNISKCISRGPELLPTMLSSSWLWSAATS